MFERDRWVWNLNGSGLFRVCDIRNLLDEKFLPKDEAATRWIKYIPIKINIFAWKVSLDPLPTRVNLAQRGIQCARIVIVEKKAYTWNKRKEYSRKSVKKVSGRRKNNNNESRNKRACFGATRTKPGSRDFDCDSRKISGQQGGCGTFV
uniref:RNA-directed DNA polymerase, eukaryota n=1 Tax=Tanacetum cinerariifolium TaxID=118510 RepID=A0A699HI51_TANCI|nr:RNA-directed DNA polymerase, eukaryota [Tanacetum cinerariifolium]